MTAQVRRRVLRLLIAIIFFSPCIAWAQCVVPDNGGGTVTLPPPGCAYLSPADVHRIIDGLPPGTTIELGVQHDRFICPPVPPGVCSFPPPPGGCVQPGGGLAGEQECANSQLLLTMKGTGALAGWMRTIPLPVSFETHTGPRVPGNPVQSFDTDMFRLFGQRVNPGAGDPDFDLLRITSGSDFGLPSPGHTTLVRQGPPGSPFAVDSFFDITYRIDYVGRPGGPLGGMSGSTTGTIRMATGPGGQCIHGLADCDDANPCTTDSCQIDTCIALDNGGGTVDLPPAGCGYVSPADVHAMINGLPPGAELRVGVQHSGFLLTSSGPGGTLGGEVEQFSSLMNLAITGTGPLSGFSRLVTVPVGSETHIGPRTPGTSPQSFPTDMFSIQGQIVGDPDFDLLRITAGTAFGLPSPGHTTLTQQPNGTWAVDSFFDIFYRIDFVGNPGGTLGGMSGSTTGRIRMHASGGGTCVHAPVVCDDGNTCTSDSCNPLTGLCESTPMTCDDGNPCTKDSCVPSAGSPCDVPDNGGGTATLPPAGCGYVSPADLHEIINGLPAGTTIQVSATHKGFFCPAASGVCSFPLPNPGVDCDQAGGTLGGEQECAGSTLVLELTGTGMLAGFQRSIDVGIDFETHTAPRTPGTMVQSFDTDMFRLFGQISGIGDPDFDLLRIVGGSDFGLPSPGHTTLTQNGPNWAVDSFFDIDYRIDFVGHPGGALSGMSGSTTGTIKMVTGDGECLNEPIACDDGDPCTIDSCNPATGGCDFTPGGCDDGDPCTADQCVSLTGPACTVPDNGGGTVTLPPAGCGYVSPADVHKIIDGLPVGTTIELAVEHKNFTCPAVSPVCSFALPNPGVDCDQPGGSLNGEQECANSELAMNLTGTGLLAGFNRAITLPISFETHVAPRVPFAPVQSFDTDMFRLFGQITNPGAGDPDFDLLRIVAGTDFGLPSPGHTTLTQSGPNWAVDSFFDITYRIDFVGRPGGALSGMSGSTTGTIRMGTGDGGCYHVPVICDDHDLCTTDTCDALAGGCSFAPVTCDDGIACTVDSCNPSTGCQFAPGPPAPPIGFTMMFPNPTTLQWAPVPGATHWNVYRGLMNSVGPPFYSHGCYISGSPAPSILEPMNPPLSRVFYYLTSQESQCGESGLGTSSSLVPRPNAAPCPTPP